MATLQVRSDADNLIASVSLPDGALAYASQMVPGATPAEIAENALIWMLAFFREQLRERLVANTKVETLASIEPTVISALAAFDADFPE
jgi:hypothetical protein